MSKPFAFHSAANAAPMSTAGLVGLALLLAAVPAAAQPDIFPNSEVPWTVNPAFEDDQGARLNISGASCALPQRACLAVNDTATFAQLFAIRGTRILPGPAVALTSDRPPLRRPLGIEGASQDDKFFYLVTSRNSAGLGQLDTDFLVLRFPHERLPQPPIIPGSNGGIGLQVSEKVREALGTGIPIPLSPGQELRRLTADIEGIAVKDGVIHLGLRAPVIGDGTFIISATVQAVFGAGPLNPVVHPVPLGSHTGIRDLAPVSDGLLVLAGPSRSQGAPASLFHWNDSTGQAIQIARLVEPVDVNPEALVVLEENLEFFRVLVM